MTKTTEQLAERVLQRLRIYGPGDTPSNDDAQSVKDYYSGAYAETAVTDDLPYWDEASIPDEAFEALVDLVAGRMAPEWGQNRPDLEASGLDRLRALSGKGPTGRPVTSSFF